MIPFYDPVFRLESRLSPRLEGRYDQVSHHTLLEVGDVTVHNGWTLHCADVVANSNAAEDDKEDRYAFSVAYVDARVELREDVLPSSKTNGNARHAAMQTGGSPSRGDNKGMWSF